MSTKTAKRYWWLRTPGLNGRFGAAVSTDGSIDAAGDRFDPDDYYCVRPVICVRAI